MQVINHHLLIIVVFVVDSINLRLIRSFCFIVYWLVLYLALSINNKISYTKS